MDKYAIRNTIDWIFRLDTVYTDLFIAQSRRVNSQIAAGLELVGVLDRYRKEKTMIQM